MMIKQYPELCELPQYFTAKRSVRVTYFHDETDMMFNQAYCSKLGTRYEIPTGLLNINATFDFDHFLN